MIQNQSRAHFQSCHWRLVHYGNPDRPFYAGYFVNCDQIQPTDSKIIFWLKKVTQNMSHNAGYHFQRVLNFNKRACLWTPPKGSIALQFSMLLIKKKKKEKPSL